MTNSSQRKAIAVANDPNPLDHPLFSGFRQEMVQFSPELVKHIYFDHQRNRYLYGASDGSYIALPLSDVKRRLKKLGISNARDPLTELSLIDDCLLFVQDNQSIQFAGPLAGYPCGMVEQCGNRILVTSEAKPFDIVEGEYAVLLEFLDGLLGHNADQLETFLLWWKGIIWEREKPRQALVIGGEPGSGKSLLQKIVSYTLGGRSAKPYRYLTGRTEFNSELFGAEHLIIDDESASTDHRSRESLGNEIKQIAVGSEHRLHAKGRDAIMLSPFWVLSFSLNDEEENLQVLPRMEKSLEDKIILLQARKSPLPMPTNTAEERSQFWKRLCSDASGLLYVLKDMDVPADKRSERYVVKAFHHPELLRALRNTSKETELLELIETHIRLPFRGSAASLDGMLRTAAPQQTSQLFSFPSACAALLGRLQKIHPERVESVRSKSNREWCIAPEKEQGG
ncbi:primase-helicase family protein [Tichowtungia aerotolerans]|uniref:NrS-1 polymerase-like helicase domain-containing protein n=1 Tax=Tichowtungia aerotolerans TaxID=2697043 RepID=A0A6P1M1F9_9BACT|nr:primase-helicase family protein [Tichowtungia aerotolerans]QHI68420.1 hypothetical protein GT409_02765 [Tichowtungia aerotolerans]